MFKYEIESKSLTPKDVFECGQCFRWDENDDGSYTGVFKDCVLTVKKHGDKITFCGINKEKDFEKFKNDIIDYFDLNRDYETIKNKLSKIDDNLKKSVEYGSGIRILNQELFETIISFIISANNNIPRIKGIIKRISENYGEQIEFNGNIFYTFPTVEELSKASVEDLRKLGLGFRDKRVYDTCQMIKNKEIDLENLSKLDTKDLRIVMMKFPGVGPKVCDCILLFSTLKRFDVFPIDVWVRRVMNELYIHNPDENKVSKIQIQKLADEKYGDLQGLAQQYLFYWERCLNK